MIDKHFMEVSIPSNLRNNLGSITDDEIKVMDNIWEFHTTPIPRMKFEDVLVKMNGVSKLNDILIYDCPKYVKNEFKNALNLYAKGYWVASIATTGIICEYLTKFYFPKNESQISELENMKNSKRMDFLFEKKIITKKIRKNLFKINNIRNECVHLDLTNIENLQTQCVIAINILIYILQEISVSNFQKNQGMYSQ